MPTTSNFGWTTPADTDLVKDGAAAIRTLGNGIDTSLIDLKGGTTGQVLSKASNTDLDYSWVTPNVGDITEVQAGTGISVASGTGPIPVVTNTVATAFDAAGDLVYGTGADTFTKLSLGTAGQVLTVNTGATAPEWKTPASGSPYVGCSVYRDTDLNVAHNTATAINWNLEVFDTDSFHSTTTNTSRFTIPTGKGGKYLINAQAVWDDNTTLSDRLISIRKNGTLVKSASINVGFYPTNIINAVIDAVATDYFEIFIFQNSGTTRTAYLNGTSSFAMITYLGA